MPPKKKTPAPKSVTVGDVAKYFNEHAYAEGSKTLWMSRLRFIAKYYHNVRDSTEAELDKLDLTKALNDYDKVVNLIEDVIKNQNTGKDTSISTKKQYYIACFNATRKGGVPVSKQIHEDYEKKTREWERRENEKRDLNEPKGGNAKHPDLNWTQIKKLYDTYNTEHPHGKWITRFLVIVGFYVLEVPRRVEDFSEMTLTFKMPKTIPEGKNLLVVERSKVTVVIDKFKMRWKVAKKKTKKKQMLPTFIRELKPALSSLIRDYIKQWDMKEGDYIFFKHTGSPSDKYIHLMDSVSI